MPGLALRNSQPLPLPVDVVERQRRDLAAAQTVADQQQQDRVIPLPAGGATIHTGEHPLHLGPRDRPRDIGEPVDLRPLHRAAQIAGEHTFAVRVAQEHPQHPAGLPNRRLGQPSRAAFGDERGKHRRRQLDSSLTPMRVR